jgi:glycosyltransferase involved in cell wall biosynthesis
MKCLIVVPSLIRAGAETQAIELANGLAARGHSIHLCSFEPQLDQRTRVSDEVTFHHVRRKSKYDLSLIDRLAAVIDREGIEVVQGVLQFAALVASLAAWRSRRKPPVIAAVHTTINRGPKQEWQDRLVYRRMLGRRPAVVFVCDHQRNHWVRKYPELETLAKVVHNGVAPELFRRSEFADQARRLRAEQGIPADAFVFASIAAFRPEKGHRLLLEAFSGIQGDAWLVFAGDGDLRPAMESRAAALGVQRRTCFLGNIPDARPLIAASNATVLASTAVETFSMAMLESMAMGVPMIAPQIGGLSEAIVDGQNGSLFPVGDTSALAAAMQALVAQPAEATTRGQAAERTIAEQFTLEKMVKGSERVLRDVLTLKR